MGVFFLFIISSAVMDIIKISLMPLRILFLWSIFWGIVAFAATIILTDMTRTQVMEAINFHNFMVFEWLEIGLMVFFIFGRSKLNRFLNFYPGLMIFFFVVTLSFYLLNRFPGNDFYITACISGAASILFCVGSALLLKTFKTGKSSLYIALLWCGIISIITLGIS